MEFLKKKYLSPLLLALLGGGASCSAEEETVPAGGWEGPLAGQEASDAHTITRGDRLVYEMLTHHVVLDPVAATSRPVGERGLLLTITNRAQVEYFALEERGQPCSGGPRPGPAGGDLEMWLSSHPAEDEPERNLHFRLEGDLPQGATASFLLEQQHLDQILARGKRALVLRLRDRSLRPDAYAFSRETFELVESVETPGFTYEVEVEKRCQRVASRPSSDTHSRSWVYYRLRQSVGASGDGCVNRQRVRGDVSVAGDV